MTFNFACDYKRLVIGEFGHVNEPEFKEFIDLIIGAAEQGISENRALDYAERLRENYISDTL